MEVLEEDFNVPEYLLKILGDSLRNRYLIYETDEGTKKKKFTSGCAQGSVLGPELWNVTYDGILQMIMPEDTFLVGYADDVEAVVIARNVEELQMELNQVMRRVNFRMKNHGLETAVTKTEIVLLSKKRIDNLINMEVNNTSVGTKNAAKYLGVILDTKLNYVKHLRTVANKAAEVTSSLSKMMANVRGPRPSKRRLQIRIAESIMLYGAEVYAETVRLKHTVNV